MEKGIDGGTQGSSYSLKISWVVAMAYYLLVLILLFSICEIFSEKNYLGVFRILVCLIIFSFFVFLFSSRMIFGVVCGEKALGIVNFSFLKIWIPWEKIERIEIISEGNSLAILKIYYERDLLENPIKILTRIFPKNDVLRFMDLLKEKCKNAKVITVDLLHRTPLMNKGK